MPFHDSLSKAGKLELLLQLLQDKLLSEDTAAAPKAFYDVNYVVWDKLLLAMHTMQVHLGRLEGAEQMLRELIDRRKDQTNLSHLHSLSVMLEKNGDYVGAEETERPVRIWLDEKLGKDSPQVLGSLRIMARNIWRQGPSKLVEACECILEVMALIDASCGGRFAVYQHEQRATTEKMIATLDGWDGA
jgi:hypothetical protein